MIEIATTLSLLKKIIPKAQQFLLLGLFSFMTKALHAQSLDSLINTLNKENITVNQLEDYFLKNNIPKDSIAEYAYWEGRNTYTQNLNRGLAYFHLSAKQNSNTDFSCRSELMKAMAYIKHNKEDSSSIIFKNFLKKECSEALKAIAKIELSLDYDMLEDYETAKQLSLEGLKVLDTLPNYKSFQTKALFLLGKIDKFNGDYESALNFYSKYLESVDQIGDAEKVSKAYISKAQIYDDLKEYTLAEQNYVKGNQIAKDAQLWNNYYFGKDQLGLTYAKIGKTNKAIQCFNTVINQTNYSDNKWISSALANKADLLYKTGQTQESVELYEQSLAEFFAYENNTIKDIQSIKDKDVFVQIIAGYLKILPKNKVYESKVNQLTSYITSLAENNLSYTSQQSIYAWRKKVKPIYESAISYHTTLNNPGKVFELIEQSKAIVLLQELQQNYLFANDKRGNQLHQKLLSLETALETADIDTNKTELLLSIDEIKDSIQFYLKSKSVQDPLKISTLEEVQRKLSVGTVLNNYFWGENNLYYIAVKANSTTIQSIPLNDQEKEELKTFIIGLHNPYESKTIAETQHAIAKKWKKRLSITDQPNSIILPDGLIAFLPLEALSNDREDNTQTTSYGFSASTYFLQQHQKKPKGNVLAFLPIEYEPSLALSDLTYSTIEVSPLKKYKGQSLMEEKATKQALINSINNHNIVHLSTHASADPENALPWLATYDEKMLLPEIYQLKLNANLVILSACETNLGEQINGEGVLNLTRGFTQAGANSIIASQWQVNEKSTAEILSNFYDNLNNGYTKAQSLQLAKQQFKNDHPDLAQSPYYWAGLVYYGQDGQLNIEKNIPWVTFLHILSILALFIFILIKIKSKV